MPPLPPPPTPPPPPCLSLDFDLNPAWSGCPSGWGCSPSTLGGGFPSAYAGNSAHGSQFFSVAEYGDAPTTKTGSATSYSFTLPDNAVKLKFLLAGNGAAPSGLYIRTTAGDTDLCTYVGPSTNAGTLVEIECAMSGHGGEDVYLFVNDASTTALLYIDHIRFVDAQDNFIYLDFECRPPHAPTPCPSPPDAPSRRP